MRTIVQKFGGTSLDTAELRARVSDIIYTAINDGYYVAVVVSAMGRKNDPYSTDSLINLVKQININPDIVELDTLMSCGETISGIVLSNLLKANGIASRFLNAEQAGIITDNNHGNAHILYVNSENILKCFEQGITPVIAGFQGINEKGQITTLGRGGSDTTASAVAVALNADYIDIYTDVEGVMTADPRIVKDARLLKLITYNEICQLAREGAKVLHPRAVEIAMQKAIPIRVRSTKSDKTGTIVANHYPTTDDLVNIIRDRLITGITYTSDIVQFKILKYKLINKVALGTDHSTDLARDLPWGSKNIELKIFKS